MSSFEVLVRAPLHRESPWARFRRRWSERRARRARRRSSKPGRSDDDKSSWWDGIDIFPDDFEALAFIVIAIAAVVAVVLLAPWVWLLVLLVVETVLWLAIVAAGITAALVLRRPWQVVVVDATGSEVAVVGVRGRRAARRHAEVVRGRLRGVTDPAFATSAAQRRVT